MSEPLWHSPSQIFRHHDRTRRHRSERRQKSGNHDEHNDNSMRPLQHDTSRWDDLGVACCKQYPGHKILSPTRIQMDPQCLKAGLHGLQMDPNASRLVALKGSTISTSDTFGHTGGTSRSRRLCTLVWTRSIPPVERLGIAQQRYGRRLQSLNESGLRTRKYTVRRAAKNADLPPLLLRTCRGNPQRGAREGRDEISSLHSITLSATGVQVLAEITMLSSLALGGRCKNFIELDPTIWQRPRFLLPSFLYLCASRACSAVFVTVDDDLVAAR